MPASQGCWDPRAAASHIAVAGPSSGPGCEHERSLATRQPPLDAFATQLDLESPRTARRARPPANPYGAATGPGNAPRSGQRCEPVSRGADFGRSLQTTGDAAQRTGGQRDRRSDLGNRSQADGVWRRYGWHELADVVNWRSTETPRCSATQERAARPPASRGDCAADAADPNPHGADRQLGARPRAQLAYVATHALPQPPQVPRLAARLREEGPPRRGAPAARGGRCRRPWRGRGRAQRQRGGCAGRRHGVRATGRKRGEPSSPARRARGPTQTPSGLEPADTSRKGVSGTDRSDCHGRWCLGLCSRPR